MIRRVWGSRNFANCIALLALFVGLGGTTLGSSAPVGGPKVSEAFVQQLLNKFEKPGNHITGAMIENGSLAGADLKPKSINTGKIKPDAITAQLIKDQTITGEKLKPKSVSGDVLMPQTVTETQLKPNTITDEAIAPKGLTNSSIQTSTLSGVEKCSGNLRGPFGDVCTTELQTAATWDQAELACDGLGLRLPTITEALRALTNRTEPQEIWTDEVYGASGEFRVAMKRHANGQTTLEQHTNGESLAYRCVVKPSSTT